MASGKRNAASRLPAPGPNRPKGSQLGALTSTVWDCFDALVPGERKQAW